MRFRKPSAKLARQHRMASMVVALPAIDSMAGMVAA
jgi:hypothetical protein